MKPSPGLDWPKIRARSLKIAKRLGLSPELTDDQFDEEGTLGAGGVRITRADRQLISLGRALVMNPELSTWPFARPHSNSVVFGSGPFLLLRT